MISEPLRNLTKAWTLLVFGKEEKEAFKELKKCLSSTASPVGLRAILTQIQRDGPRIISYTNHSPTETERRDSQTEEEVLALIWACEKFQTCN